MSAPSLWAGLGRSPMLQDIGEAERSPVRLIATLAVGAVMAMMAAILAFFVLAIPYALSLGLGDHGLRGLGEATLGATKPQRWDLRADVVAIVLITVLDATPFFAFVGVAAAFSHRPLRAYATAALRFRWPLLGAGMVLGCLVLAPVVVTQRVLGGASPPPIAGVSPTFGGRAVYLLASLLLVPAAIAEELVFRGWLTRQVAAFARGSAPPILLGAALFAAAHFVGADPAAFADPAAAQEAIMGFVELAIMGAGFSYMTLRLGGIEFAAGAHAANNLLIVLFVAPLRFQAPAAGGGWFGLVPDLAQLAGYVLITEAVARTAFLRRLTGVHPGELSPADIAGQRP